MIWDIESKIGYHEQKSFGVVVKHLLLIASFSSKVQVIQVIENPMISSISVVQFIDFCLQIMLLWSSFWNCSFLPLLLIFLVLDLQDKVITWSSGSISFKPSKIKLRSG